MLVIRVEQLEELNRRAEEALRADILRHVSTAYPKSLEGKTENETRHTIDDDIKLARDCGLGDREGIFDFVDNEFYTRENQSGEKKLSKYSIG